MEVHAIYMMGGRGSDSAIQKALVDAGCEVHSTHNIPETLMTLQARANSVDASKQTGILLVAEIQFGAIPLLTLLRENGIPLPPTLLFDHEGNNIQAAVKAMQLGVQEYLLASEPVNQRELRPRVLIAGVMNGTPGRPHPPTSVPALMKAPASNGTRIVNGDFRWDRETHVIYVDGAYVCLSPIEARLFDLLLAKRYRMVSMQELIGDALGKPGLDIDNGVKLLRPHMMRLRNKLEEQPQLAHRIINVRGNGYMLI